MANAAALSKTSHTAGAEKANASVAAEARSLNRDVAGLGLAASTLMLLVSVVTRDPRDPITTPAWPLRLLYTPDITHYPLNDGLTNACGYWGAFASGMLIEAIGISVAVVIIAAAVVAFAILGRGKVHAPVMRSLGATVVVLAVSTAAGLAPLRLDGFPAVGAGGYLGAMASIYLQEHFALPGAWILTVTVLLIGLMLTTDYALWYAGAKVLSCGALVSRRSFETVHDVLPMGKKKKRRVVTDLDEPMPIAGDSAVQSADVAGNRDTRQPHESEPTVKVRQRPKAGSEAPVGEAGPSAPGAPRSTDLQVAEAATADSAAAAKGSKGKVAAAAAGLAGLAAAVGLTKAKDDSASPDEESHPQAAGSITDNDPESDEEETDESVVRELEIDGEEVVLRGDQGHDEPAPKIRMPKKRDELQAVMDAVNEDLPDGADDYRLPSLELLDESDDICYDDQTAEVRRKAKILEETFKNFGFNIRVVEIETGPVIAQYEVELEAGLRLSKITGLADDLAIALRVPSVRIVAPIPGKNTVGIEVPNEQRQVVRLREVIEECAGATRKMNIPVFLGKDVSGNPLTIDLAKMPHLLIAGRTGTGKSVCLNAIITSVLMTCRPDEVRMLMIDPKMVELSGYGRLPHLMHPVVTDMKKAEAILAWAVEKMEERYSLLAKAGVRHINSYNDLGREELYRRLEIDEADDASGVPEKLPFIVIIADEMADLMMTAGKEVETHIIRLAQKSRAVGIHLILATQKPTVDVITGLIKSNLPARLSFQVASRTDSRVVLDENGADKLLGNGDMLFLWPGTSTLIRGQGTYLSDGEIDRVVDHCSTGEQNFVGELMNLKVEEPDAEGTPIAAGGLKKRDDLYESAIEVVIREGRGSVSLLQRCLGIGYGRAARLIDYMAEDGIVGQYNGSQAREVVISMADWERMQGLDSAVADDEDSFANAEP
jgi:DNA segregation ATPase FtsK/SpoIIIE, S-DNA-T family